MYLLEFRLYGTENQFTRIDESIRTTKFIRNKCIRLWMDSKGKKKISKYEMSAYCAELAQQHDFCAQLNSMARQAAAERAYSSVGRFYDNCKKKTKGKKGFPKFQKICRSVEFKTSGWKFQNSNKQIYFGNTKSPKDFDIGWLKLKGGRPILEEYIEKIKRVRVVKKADKYYCQFCIDINKTEYVGCTGTAIGLDVGLEFFYTDSNGNKVENPRHLGKSLVRLKRLSRQHSKKTKRSANRRKAQKKLAKRHLKVASQRKDFVVKTARCVVKSNDFVAVEKLQVRNMIRSKMARSIADASWSMFRSYLEYFGNKFGKIVVAVNPKNTSQKCSKCGKLPTESKKLKDREHHCEFCGLNTCRDHNAAINILVDGLSTVGHTGSNAWGDESSTCLDANLDKQLLSANQEPLVPFGAGISRL
jgi:putative transposase